MANPLSWLFSPGTQTTKSSPWGPQQPHLENIFGEAESLYGQGPYVPTQSPMTEQYLSGIPGMVSGAEEFLGSGRQAITDMLAGGGVSGPGGDYLSRAAAGEFVGQNPYLQDLYQQGAQDIAQTFSETVMPGITSQFAGSKGAFGSGAHQAALQSAQKTLGGQLGRLYTGIMSPAYSQERGLQQQAGLGLADIGSRNVLGATGQMPGMVSSMYGARNPLLTGGQLVEGYQQREHMAPWMNLDLYKSMVGGNYGGTQTMPGPSPFERGLGIASDVATVAMPFMMPGAPMGSNQWMQSQGFMATPGSGYGM